MTMISPFIYFSYKLRNIYVHSKRRETLQKTWAIWPARFFLTIYLDNGLNLERNKLFLLLVIYKIILYLYNNIKYNLFLILTPMSQMPLKSHKKKKKLHTHTHIYIYIYYGQL